MISNVLLDFSNPNYKHPIEIFRALVLFLVLQVKAKGLDIHNETTNLFLLLL